MNEAIETPCEEPPKVKLVNRIHNEDTNSNSADSSGNNESNLRTSSLDTSHLQLNSIIQAHDVSKTIHDVKCGDVEEGSKNFIIDKNILSHTIDGTSNLAPHGRKSTVKTQKMDKGLQNAETKPGVSSNGTRERAAAAGKQTDILPNAVKSKCVIPKNPSNRKGDDRRPELKVARRACTKPVSQMQNGNNKLYEGCRSVGSQGGFRERHNSWHGRPAARNNNMPINNNRAVRYVPNDEGKENSRSSNVICPFTSPPKPIVSWVTCSEGRVQPGAIAAGKEKNNPYTFVGRVTLRNERFDCSYAYTYIFIII